MNVIDKTPAPPPPPRAAVIAGYVLGAAIMLVVFVGFMSAFVWMADENRWLDWLRYVPALAIGISAWLTTLPWPWILGFGIAIWVAVSLHNIRVILELMARSR
jgi:hypothetical protein